MFRLICSVFAAGFCSLTAVANAAEVVEMRLGRHDAFTRVVFELDAPTGYSLEQAVVDGGGTELVVTLDARANNQEATLRDSQVRGVSLTGHGAKSVARIRLGSKGLRVKEMILGSPPRIVLDVLGAGEATVAKTAAPKPATPKPAAKSTPPPAPATHSIAPKNQLSEEPEQPVASISQGAAPSPSRVAPRPAVATPAVRPAVPARAPAPAPVSPPVAVVPKAGPAPTAMAPTKVADTPPPPARRKPLLPPAPASLPEAKSNSLLTPVNIGLALVGLVGGGAFFMLRRRGEGKELLDDEDFDADAASDENPFASLGDDFVVSAEQDSRDETAEIPMALHVDDSEASASNEVDEFASDTDPDADVPVAKTAADAGRSSGPQEDLFETSVTESLGADEPTKKTTTTTDSAAKLGTESAKAGGEKMETYTDSGINTGRSAMPPMTGAGENSEIMRMLREFEQRVSSLESRLEEVSEAKERLERQVAAQTEELRVQRAAIARTQRALRNMNRPDDESPTEPALRDPNA